MKNILKRWNKSTTTFTRCQICCSLYEADAPRQCFKCKVIHQNLYYSFNSMHYSAPAVSNKLVNSGRVRRCYNGILPIREGVIMWTSPGAADKEYSSSVRQPWKMKMCGSLAANYPHSEICSYESLFRHLISLCNGALEHHSSNRASLP